MALSLETNGKRYRGLSTDTKPEVLAATATEPARTIPEGSVLNEIDTGRRYVFNGGQWILQPRTLETLMEEMIALQQETLQVLRSTHRGNELFVWNEEVRETDE